MNKEHIHSGRREAYNRRKKIDSAAFFYEIRVDTYICSIFGEKILHPVFRGLKEMQLFIELSQRKPQGMTFLLFVCRRFAPLEQINTLHIPTVKIKNTEK